MSTNLNIAFNAGLEHSISDIARIFYSFYCQESAPEVLNILKDKIAVCQYNSVSTHFTQKFSYVTDKEVLSFAGGIAIRQTTSHNTNQRREVKLKDVVALLPKGTGNIPDATRVIEDMVASYLIDINVVDKGYVMRDTRSQDIAKYPLSVISLGIQEAVDKNKFHKKYLADILEYGKVVIKESFNKSDINDIINNIICKTPISFDPQDGPKIYQIANYSFK